MRQAGRLRAANVIDVGCNRSDIIAGIRHALRPQFKTTLHTLVNPYGDGRASERIVSHLCQVPLNDRLIKKQFHDLPLK
jgi:UDP-N-acetylglucosamine 2-epimerase